jgi:hypothetical protein
VSEREWKERYATIIALLREVHTWGEFDQALEVILTLYGDPTAEAPAGTIHLGGR